MPTSTPVTVLVAADANQASAKAKFIEENPRWMLTVSLDEMRRTEFARLDAGSGSVYLDWTGAGLYPKSVVEQHFRLLMSSTIGNPHSVNPTHAPSSRRADGRC